MNVLDRIKYLVIQTKGKSLNQIFYYIFVEYMICNILRNIHYYIIRGKKKKDVVPIQGSLMMLDLTEPGINKDLYQFGIREKRATRLYQSILEFDMEVLDIGANIGYYALMACKAGANVTAFEPVDSNYDQLKYNIGLNNYRNITTHKYAVGLFNKKDTIYITEKCNLSSLRHKVGTPQKVQVINLDGWYVNKKTPDIIRMDVEGYEWEILKGGLNTISRMKKGSWIFVEIHDIGSKRAQEVERMLNMAGFNLIYELPIEGKEADIFNHSTYRNKFNLEYDQKGCRECFFHKVR